VGEVHGVKYRGGYCFHSVHEATSKEDVVIQLGIDEFDVDVNVFTSYFSKKILVEALWLGWVAIVCSKSNVERMSLGEPSCFHTVLDIIHVDSPSSMIHLCTDIFWILTQI
jgi:hypothetical protein